MYTYKTISSEFDEHRVVIGDVKAGSFVDITIGKYVDNSDKYYINSSYDDSIFDFDTDRPFDSVDEASKYIRKRVKKMTLYLFRDICLGDIGEIE